jgi:hypothetical protein
LNVAALTGLALLTACTSVQSQMETGGQMLPRPQVVVESFAVSPAEVKVSEGLSQEVRVETILLSRRHKAETHALHQSRALPPPLAMNLPPVRDPGGYRLLSGTTT